MGSKKEAAATGSSIAKNLGSNIIIPKAVKQEMRVDEFLAYWIEHYCIDENDNVRSAPYSQRVPVHWKKIKFINIRPEDGTLITPSIMRHVSGVIHGNAKHKGIDAQMGVAYPDFCYHALRHTHGTALVEAKSDWLRRMLYWHILTAGMKKRL